MKKLSLVGLILVLFSSIYPQTEAEITKGLRKQVDPIERMTIYHSKTSPKRIYTPLRFNSYFYIYVCVTDNKEVIPRLVAQVERRHWLSFNRVVVAAGDLRWEKEFDIHRLVRRHTNETEKEELYNIRLNPDEIDALAKIAASDTIIVRFANDNHYEDVTFDKTTSRSLSQMIHVYRQLSELYK